VLQSSCLLFWERKRRGKERRGAAGMGIEYHVLGVVRYLNCFN
jgi:hypothetical protein